MLPLGALRPARTAADVDGRDVADPVALEGREPARVESRLAQTPSATARAHGKEPRGDHVAPRGSVCSCECGFPRPPFGTKIISKSDFALQSFVCDATHALVIMKGKTMYCGAESLLLLKRCAEGAVVVVPRHGTCAM